MTEDEAFIRTIVDRPGDDLPRLVYADWLDERDDPRGAYLRAELEWAKAKQTAGFIVLRLNGLAERLDPVWVARVSRPPIGVCCEHVSFTDSGPPLDNAELGFVEARLKVQFPDQFRAFLLNHNGGKPVPPCLPPVPQSWLAIDLEIGEFYTASRRAWPTPANSSFTWELQIEGERFFLNELYHERQVGHTNPLLAGLIPFADTVHDLGRFFIACDAERSGRVFHFQDYFHDCDDPTHLIEYSHSFAHLLSVLRLDQSAD